MSESPPAKDAVAPAAANDSAPEPCPFPAVVIGADTFDLEHLRSFAFKFDTVTRKDVTCFVQFSTHCYSDSYDPARHEHHVVVVDERGVNRCFDPARHRLSIGLRPLLEALPTARVYQTHEGNFAVITTEDGLEYRVFFNLRRDGKRKLRLYVESAYPPETERGDIVPATSYQKVRFGLLCDYVLEGKALKFQRR